MELLYPDVPGDVLIHEAEREGRQCSLEIILHIDGFCGGPIGV
jgi:hypothetical protein